MLLNWYEVRVGKALVEFFTLQYYGKIHRFVSCERPKRLFKFGEIRWDVCYCNHEEKLNLQGFTQSGCYGNQPQPSEAVFYSIDSNTFCSFTKQDLNVNQAYLVSFCFFFLCDEPKFWQLLSSCFQCFLPVFGNNFILYHWPVGQIIPGHVTEVEMLRFIWLLYPDPDWLAQVSLA